MSDGGDEWRRRVAAEKVIGRNDASNPTTCNIKEEKKTTFKLAPFSLTEYMPANTASENFLRAGLT